MLTFLSLPFEVRLQIYRHLLQPAPVIPSYEHYWWETLNPGFALSIPSTALLLCRQIRAELLPVLFSPSNPFIIGIHRASLPPNPSSPLGTPHGDGLAVTPPRASSHLLLTVPELTKHPCRPLVTHFKIHFSLRMPLPVCDAAMRKEVAGAEHLRDTLAELAKGPICSLALVFYVWFRRSRPGTEDQHTIRLPEVFEPLRGRMAEGCVSVERWRPKLDPWPRWEKHSPEFREWMGSRQSDPVEIQEMVELISRRGEGEGDQA